MSFGDVTVVIHRNLDQRIHETVWVTGVDRCLGGWTILIIDGDMLTTPIDRLLGKLDATGKTVVDVHVEDLGCHLLIDNTIKLPTPNTQGSGDLGWRQIPWITG
jgi:hypothetical protein